MNLYSNNSNLINQFPIEIEFMNVRVALMQVVCAGIFSLLFGNKLMRRNLMDQPFWYPLLMQTFHQT